VQDEGRKWVMYAAADAVIDGTGTHSRGKRATGFVRSRKEEDVGGRMCSAAAGG
jgi:hypothetical protein